MNQLLHAQDDFKPCWVENRSRRSLRRAVKEQASKRFAVTTNLLLDPGLQDTSRGPSNSIWGQVSRAIPSQDPENLMEVYEDFLLLANTPSTSGGAYTGGLGRWSFYADQHGVLGTDPNNEGGIALLSDGNNNTVNIALTSTAGFTRFISPASGFPLQGPIFFEARVAVGAITTGHRDAFVGLTNIGAPAVNNVIGSGANTLATAPGLFGFHFRDTTNPSDVGVAYNVAGGTVQYPTNLQTLSTTVVGSALTAYASSNGLATGFIKLGFVYNPSASNVATRCVTATGSQTVGNLYQPTLRFYVNGQLCNTFMDSSMVQAATFPSTFLAPALAYLSRSGTGDGGFYVDWVRCIGAANI